MSQEPSSRRERSWSDRIISAGRSLRYRMVEPYRLERERKRHSPGGTTTPLISIILPTHNRAALLLTRALPSVLAQTYGKIEVIVAAHGCTDETKEAVEAQARDDPRVRVIEVPRERTYPPTVENHWLAGPVAPANAALKACKGEWIARIDDDDIWMYDHLERLLRFAQEGDYEFVSSAYETHKDIIWSDGETPPAGGIQTTLYRSYLRFMKFNPDCYRKSRDRVNDVDLIDRFRGAGVRMGLLNKVTASVLPRPGETKIGLKAYQHDADAIEAHFAFEDGPNGGLARPSAKSARSPLYPLCQWRARRK